LTSNDIFNIIAEEFYTGKKVNKSILKGIYEELSTALEMEQMSDMRYEVEGKEAEESYPNWDTVKDADLSTVKRFNLSMRSLFGLPMLSDEVASVVMKAREIEVLRKGGKWDKFTDALNEFRNYILEALFVDKKREARIGVFQEAVRKISGEERRVKGLKRRDLNNIINFYQFSTSSMLKSLKMELWAWRSHGGRDLYIELMPDDIHPITGKKQSKYVMKSFLDDMPGDIGAKTIILKFSNIVQDTGTDRVDRDGNKFKNYRGIATRQTPEASKALDVRLGKQGMALIGPKGLDKAVFVIVHITEEDFANAENIEEYLNKEINNKYMTDEDKASFIAHSEEMKEISPNVDAQIVAYHEWFKSLFGNEYLIWQRKALKDKPLDKEGTTANIMNRTRIPFSEGQTLRGLGGVSTMVIDPNDAIIEIPKSDGTGVNTYDLGKKWDGFMGWSSAMRYRVQDRWGRKPLRGEHNLTEVKPAVWHKTEKGLLAMKMNWFLPRPGMRITTKDGTEILRVEEDSKKNIRIVSADGEIDTFATLEEAKLMWGEFDGATNSIINLSEESIKFIHGGDQKGKDAVAFPFGAVDLMLSPDLQADPDFRKGYRAITKEMLSRANSAIKFLINSRHKPINFMKILEEVGVLKDHVSVVEEELLSDLENPAAIFHKIFMDRLEPTIFNYMVKASAYKGRIQGKGTYLALAPDFEGDIPNDGIKFGEANNPIMNFIRQSVFSKEELAEFKELFADRDTRVDAIAMINKALKERPTYVMRIRYPIPDIAAFGIKQIKEIIDGAGNVAMLSEEDVIKVIQGDYDGDALAIIPVTQAEAKAYLAMQESKAYQKRKRPVVLPWFEHSEEVGLLSDKNSLYELSGRMAVGDYSAGIINNLKAIRELLVWKGAKMVITDSNGDDITYSVINPDETVDMTYAPLNITKKSIYDEIIEAGALVIDINGDEVSWEEVKAGKKEDESFYLRTNSAHELAVLLQASVDNPKEQLLSHWGYHGYPFLWSRVIKRSDGKPFIPQPPGVRRAESVAQDIDAADFWHWLGKVFKYSPVRMGRDSFQRAMSAESLVANSRLVRDIIESDDYSNEIKYQMSDQVQQWKWRDKKKNLKSLTIKNRVAPIEEVLRMYADLFDEAIGEDDHVPNNVVTRISQYSMNDAHKWGVRLLSKNLDLVLKKAGIKRADITKESFSKAKKWANRVGSAWYSIFEDGEYKDKSGNVHTKGTAFTFQTALHEATAAFTVDYIPEFMSMSKIERMIATYHFLTGITQTVMKKRQRGSRIQTISKVEQLMPLEIMDKDIILEYFNSWAEALNNLNEVMEIVGKEELEPLQTVYRRMTNKIEDITC